MLKREKRRYLALKASGAQPHNEQSVLDAVQASVHTLFGEYGASKANLKLINKRSDQTQVVLCCSHKSLEQVRAAIALTTSIDGEVVAVHVLGVSGTLKALAKKTATS